LSSDFVQTLILGDFAALEISDSALLKKMQTDSSPWMASKSSDHFCVVSELVNSEEHEYYDMDDSKLELLVNDKLKD